MIAILVLYIVSFAICVLLAKLNKRSKMYDDGLQKTLKIVTLIPLMNTFIAFIGTLTIIAYFVSESEKMKVIRDLYNKLF